MAVIEFEDNENEYLHWIANNPEGYVLTTARNISPNYMSLHRATCRMISQYMRNMAKDAFTGKKYKKICSARPSDLDSWIKGNGGGGFTKLCSKCNPDISGPIIDQAGQFQFEFENAVRKSAESTSEEREERLRVAAKHPELITITTTVFRRNADVVAQVLYRAQGNCEVCGAAAPFMRAKDGTPYLEVHHVIPLSDGGEDIVQNAIALCPNCHRRAHYG